MAPLAYLTAAAVIAASLADAHFVIVRVAHNGIWQRPMQYIRNNTSPWTEISSPPDVKFDNTRLWKDPVYSFDAPESVRCGRNHQAWANDTEILKVKAGDTIEVVATQEPPSVWDQPDMIQWENCPQGRGLCHPWYLPNYGVTHWGPFTAHLSRVPTSQTVHTYDGSGEWIKINTIGAETEVHYDPSGHPVYWLPLNGARLITRIPKQTPSGQYFLRAAVLFPGRGELYPQHYPACIQIEVDSNFTASLPKGIKIPEDMPQHAPGMYLASDYGQEGSVLLKGNRYPGGPLWDGEKLIEDKVMPNAA